MIGLRIVGHVDVGPSVLIQIGNDDPESPARESADPRLDAHIRERAIAVVAIQHVGHAGEDLRAAVLGPARVITTDHLRIVFDVHRHVKIQIAVAIVVEERARARPTVAADAGGDGDVGKRTVPLVAVQRVRSEVGHEHIAIPVVVEIADRTAHAVAGVTEPGCDRDVSETPVRFLMVQTVHRSLRSGFPGPVRTAVHEVNVQSPIVIIIKERPARADDLREKEAPVHARIMTEIKPYGFGDVREPTRSGCGRCGVGVRGIQLVPLAPID